MYPLLLSPAFKDYIWGGTRLRDDFGKDCPLERIAESWELSCHPDGLSVIANGEYKGQTLKKFLDDNPDACGTACARFDDFPVLIKLIDAKNDLSVQVHPDDDYARRVEGGSGKTEMWYIVDAEEGASLLYGFKTDITKEEFRRRIENNTLLEVTQSVPVKKGDVFFIRAGTLHAIGKGILIAEIQQSSNTTYRIYDYGRLGADGKPRELHIEKALDVTSLSPAKPYPPTEWKDFSRSASNETEWREKLLSSCEYFAVKALEVTGSAWLEAPESTFVHLLVLDGETVFSSVYGKDHTLKLTKGSSVFIPAGYGHFELTGDCSAVITYIE